MGMIMKDGIPYGGIYPIDDAPTQGSNNAVKSGGVHSALSNKVDKVAGKGLSENDYSDTEKGKVSANAEAIEAMVNVTGACNLCPNDMQSGSQQDVTYTVNSDGTISLAGTALITTDRNVTERANLKAGSYKVSGCPVGGGESTYLLMVYNDTTHQYIAFDSGSGASFTLASDSILQVTLRVYGGANVDGKVFKPMLYDARLTPSGYVPYAMTNSELTERMQIVPFTLPNDISSKSIGDTVEIPIHHPGVTYLFTALTLSIFSQNRIVDGCFEQIAVSGTNLYLIGLKQTFSSSYNGATGYLTFVKI